MGFKLAQIITCQSLRQNKIFTSKPSTSELDINSCCQEGMWGQSEQWPVSTWVKGPYPNLHISVELREFVAYS